jgi:hypothetical protein
MNPTEHVHYHRGLTKESPPPTMTTTIKASSPVVRTIVNSVQRLCVRYFPRPWPATNIWRTATRSHSRTKPGITQACFLNPRAARTSRPTAQRNM